MPGVGSGHHVLGVEHLLGELGDGDGTVLLASAGGEGGESDHEEVETREGDCAEGATMNERIALNRLKVGNGKRGLTHVDGQLSEVRVELTGESQTRRDTGHDDGDEVVEITVGGGLELQSPEADVVKGFVVDTEGLVGVFDELMDGEGSVVRLDDGVGDLMGDGRRKGDDERARRRRRRRGWR